MTLTIAYMTCRKNPRFEWFADSIREQLDPAQFDLLVVDFYAKERDLAEYARSIGINAKSMTPKPTVWQGEHRLVKENHFAAANARNTAICAANGDYLVFADDLSVARPGWGQAVLEAAKAGCVVCGSYQKGLNLRTGLRKKVVDGKETEELERFIEFNEHPPGKDARLLHQTRVGPCHPGWFYGCSCGAPLEAFLKINGYPEIADGMGYEDAVTGMALAENGYKFVFDPRMATVESEEGHHRDKPFIRSDPGVSPNDKSHALLNICHKTKHFDNYFGPDGIRGLRERIQAGEPFPVVQIPEHEWFTGKPLREL